jgi:zinc/manganese transport system substrate-binding protein
VLQDLVRNVGGDKVAVKTLVGPDGDAHTYEPTPSDAKAISGARLVVINGLGLEGWLTRLMGSAGFTGTRVVATEGIAPLTMAEAAGGKAKTVTDPHAWQSLKNGQIYVANIAKGLAAADPANADAYRQNAEAYSQRLAALDTRIRTELAEVPAAQRRVITTHDAFQYYGRAYGVTFIAPIGLSTEEGEPSAGDVAKLERQIKREKLRALFLENISNSRLIEQLARIPGPSSGRRCSRTRSRSRTNRRRPISRCSNTTPRRSRPLNDARTGIQTQTGASTYTLDSAAINAMPGGDNVQLNQVLLQAPEVAQDSFGQFHVRGEHNGLQYRINGLILPEGISVFGQSLDPRLIESVTLVTGALPAEYGLRTAGIIDVKTKTDAIEPGGSISIYGGSHGTVQPSISYAGGSGDIHYFVSADFAQQRPGHRIAGRQLDAAARPHAPAPRVRLRRGRAGPDEPPRAGAARRWARSRSRTSAGLQPSLGLTSTARPPIRARTSTRTSARSRTSAS